MKFKMGMSCFFLLLAENKGLHLLSFTVSSSFFLFFKTPPLMNDVQNALQWHASLIYTLSRRLVLFNEFHPLSIFQRGREKQANQTLEPHKIRTWQKLLTHTDTSSPQYFLCCTLVDSQPPRHECSVSGGEDGGGNLASGDTELIQSTPPVDPAHLPAYTQTHKPVCRGQPGLTGWEMAALLKHHPD